MNPAAAVNTAAVDRPMTAVTVATLLLLGVGTVLIVYWDDWHRMARIWSTSQTFAHGALIPPISLWLLWRARQQISQATFRPWSMPLLGLAVCSALWLLAALAGVNAPREFAVVGMIVCAAAMACGPQVARIARFPLAFLFLMVPFGEFLLPSMMESTANFTIWALRLTGIPVYREGLQFVLPTGRWSVVEACSGLRYLIASVVLGMVYAYVTFRSLKRRALFVMLAIAVPVAANWLRAYGIVMIGHFSGMTLAAGVDHLIYGWLFFGAVMFALFWIGARWREAPEAWLDPTRSPDPSQTHPARALMIRAQSGSWFIDAAPWAAALGLLLGTHLLAENLQQRTVIRPFSQRVTSALPEWVPNSLPLGLRPAFQGAQQEFLGLLADPHPHGVQVAYYARQHETAELIAHGNAIVLTGDKEWHVAHETTGLVDGSAGRIPVRRYELVSAASGRRLLALHWFTVAGIATNRADVAKILTAWSLLNGRGDHSTSTAIWIQVDRQPTESERDEIFRGMTPHAVAVHAAIDQAMK